MRTGMPASITMSATVDAEGNYLDGGKTYWLYGALEPWFDKTWRPAEIKLVR